MSNVNLTFSGKWQDRYYRNGELVGSTEVRHNQIQDTAYLAVSALLANQFYQQNMPVETPTTWGISYVDYGAGSADWDLPENQPVPQPKSDTTLNNAVYRKAVNPSDVSFVPLDDPFGGDAVSVTPTTRLRVRLTLTEQEFVGTLREFGLFCRFTDDLNVANALNEGLMFNWVMHPTIEKDNTLRIERIVEITITNN